MLKSINDYAAAVQKIKNLMDEISKDYDNCCREIDLMNLTNPIDPTRVMLPFVTDPKVKMVKWTQIIKSNQSNPEQINGSSFWSFDIPSLHTDMIIITTQKETDPKADIFLRIGGFADADQCNCDYKPLLMYHPMRIFMKEKRNNPNHPPPLLTTTAVMFSNELRKNIILNK
jgi:hypothetical protein